MPATGVQLAVLVAVLRQVVMRQISDIVAKTDGTGIETKFDRANRQRAVSANYSCRPGALLNKLSTNANFAADAAQMKCCNLSPAACSGKTRKIELYQAYELHIHSPGAARPTYQC